MNNNEKRSMLLEQVAHANGCMGDELIFCHIGEMHTGEPVALVTDSIVPILMLSVSDEGKFYAHNLITHADLMFKFESAAHFLLKVDFSKMHHRITAVNDITQKLHKWCTGANELVIHTVHGMHEGLARNGALICLKSGERNVVINMAIDALGVLHISTGTTEDVIHIADAVRACIEKDFEGYTL